MIDHARTKTAQVNLRLQPDLKTMAEKAAADDHRSLTSLVEKLLTDHLRRKGYLETAGSPTRSKGAPRAAEMAGHELNKLGDETSTDEERARRKRTLISGPKEFRNMRSVAASKRKGG